MVMMLALVLLFMLTGGASAQTSRRPWWEEFDTPAATEPTSSNAIPEALVVPLDLSKVCCECVPFYLCDSDNNIVTDGSTAIGPRIGAGNRVFNVENCPGDQQFCCKPKSAPPNCDMSQNPAPNPVPVDGEGGSCDCLHWELCPEGLRISDGSAPKIFLDGNISLPAHARCLGSFQVCCALDSEPEVSTPPSDTNRLICVNPELCGADGNILAASLDLRNLAASARTPPCVSPMLACRIPADLDGTTTGPPVVPPSPPPVIVDQKCEGRRNPQGISVRIAGFNNSESQFGEFPWVGMILRTYFVADSPMNAFIGGAILVHPRIMLTAAHKVYKENVTNLHVRVGEWDIETDFEPGQHQGRAVESIVLHPLFNDKNLQHDVALVVLATPVTLQAHVRSICLARSLNDVQTNACVINGWGKNSFEGGSYQTVMKSLTLPLVAHNRCQSLLRETRLGYWFELHSSFICAGGELGKDACTSDGGGPLACPRRGAPNEYLLVGITAWGIGCGDQGVPGVYASTIADRSWITAEMERIAPDVIHTAVRRAVKPVGAARQDAL
ncbi:phenoloxidase-activating factor 2-like isoform X2 [Hyalella azteca]|uniref:Phenoloxidase-activating factor 2-like isoform X2 n=1 Tax=Hyalella azteca TaxID=294128 RepID=A0A979FMS4_HYAAZ|nr:phenoloxidase-activating factor 2-like isoform X2 [Hyalella azteca]